MAEINRKNLTPEMIMRAQECKTPEELVELAATSNIDITKEEAEAYLAELDDFEFDYEVLSNVAGGVSICYVVGGCTMKGGIMPGHTVN